MRLGVCTTDFARLPAETLFARMAKLGFSVAQLSFDTVAETGFAASGDIEIPSSVSEAALRAIRESAARHNIEVIAVNGTFNMAHPDPAVRAEGLRRFAGFADAVCALGARTVSLCTGTRNRESLWKPHPDNQSREAWADMLRTVERAVRIAEDKRLVLMVETEASNVVDSAEKARRLLDEIGSPALKMIIDCANLFRPGMAYPENVRPVLEDAFARFGADVVLAHGKDIRAGAGIDFCAAGRGIVDFPYFLALLKKWDYAGDFILHGIYDEADMPRAAEYIRKLMAK